ncbi:MAG: indolepyruvate oxidoreductase subunit beta [Bacteroidales bacterium]
MKNDIILAGVGGQGILSIAAIIGTAAVNKGLYVKQSEVHGMSQRGGDVQSHLRLSSRPIASDLIPTGAADMIISVEPLEALRYLPWLKKDGWIITNTKPYVNIPNYPPIEEVLSTIASKPHQIMIDADALAAEIGSARSANMVILGASSFCIDIPFEDLEQAIRQVFGRKGDEVVNANLAALRAGRDFSALHRKQD